MTSTHSGAVMTLGQFKSGISGYGHVRHEFIVDLGMEGFFKKSEVLQNELRNVLR